jgi:hypothetical protein
MHGPQLLKNDLSSVLLVDPTAMTPVSCAGEVAQVLLSELPAETTTVMLRSKSLPMTTPNAVFVRVPGATKLAPDPCRHEFKGKRAS